MNSILRTAATGMGAQELNVNVIANNLANINTTGFKKSKMEFQDLLYQTVRAAGTSVFEGTEVPTALEIGRGVRPVATQKIFSPGNVSATGNPLDITIVGDGFFQILQADGNIFYTRDGALKMSADGELVASDGFLLEPSISLPSDTSEISIGADGMVSALVAGNSAPQQVGQIELARFVNPAGLKSVGMNLLQETESSGAPMVGAPDQAEFGMLEQGYLELSNVEVVEELINMIVAQRAYEINSKVVSVADDMMRLANQMK